MRTVSIDRLSIRERPPGLPIMFQSWRMLLFMHWQLPPELLRPHIPESLELDTFDGKAWIGMTPFMLRHLRPPFLPPLPGLSNFNEINVRTYVHFNGVPGIWFFSLDADSALAVWGSRLAFRLPYHCARMSFKESQKEICYTSCRTAGSDAVSFEARCRPGQSLGEAQPQSLEFFLVERYCLYTVDESHLYRARIYHSPWQLREAQLLSQRSTMLEAQGLPTPQGSPLLHFSDRQDTHIWPLKKVASLSRSRDNRKQERVTARQVRSKAGGVVSRPRWTMGRAAPMERPAGCEGNWWREESLT